ncbi:hypothetical protein KY332_01310 [Candidatus Woesearchaeota archaeon]|nr:hypothetical protein [Candidatus Woesearchaeota archaeon]
MTKDEHVLTDELTGLEDYIVFKDEFSHIVQLVQHHKKPKALVMLKLGEDTYEERVKGVANILKSHFIRICRYDKKDYCFLGIYQKPDEVSEKKEEILSSVKGTYSGINAGVTSYIITGEEDNLDSLAETLFEEIQLE